MEYTDVDFTVDNYEVTELSEDTYELSCKVTAYPSSVVPLSTIGGEKGEVGITANLTIVYNLKDNDSLILITRVYGGWTGLIGQLQDQEVAVTEGDLGIFSDVKRWYPTGYTFDYSTDWTEYVTKAPSVAEADSGPRAFCSTDYQIIGMGGGIWSNLTLYVYVP